MAWTGDFMANLCALIAATWSEVTVILTVTETAAIPWENLVTEGLAGHDVLEPPFVVVSCGRYNVSQEHSPLEGGIYDIPVSIFRIDRRAATPGQEATMEAHLVELGVALRKEDDFSVPGQPEYDVSDTNPANAVFIQMGNHPMFAGMLQFVAVDGDVGQA